MDYAMILFSIVLFLLCWFPLFEKIIWKRTAPVTTVKAELVDKYKQDTASKYPGIFRQEGCIVVFKTKDRRLLFHVSLFSYNNYRVNQKGTLKYKGNKIISFK